MPNAPATPDLPIIKRSRWFWFRIAVSAFNGLMTVALCVLWVKSNEREYYLAIGLAPYKFGHGAPSATSHAPNGTVGGFRTRVAVPMMAALLGAAMLRIGTRTISLAERE
jgi:hypothetical protein